MQFATASAFLFNTPAPSRAGAMRLLRMFDDSDLQQMSQIISKINNSNNKYVIEPPRDLLPRRMFGRTMSDEEFFGTETNSLLQQAAGKSIVGSGGYNSFKIDLKETKGRVEISAGRQLYIVMTLYRFRDFH